MDINVNKHDKVEDLKTKNCNKIYNQANFNLFILRFKNCTVPKQINI